MTTRVELRKVTVTGPNPAKFTDPISVKVVLEVFEKVPEHAIDVAFLWSPVWDFPVDQELDEFEVGPLTSLGVHEFALESDPPDFRKIPDPTGPTALIITLSYSGRQFLHIGYNVIVSCAGDIPDVFASAEPLTRVLERCFPRQSVIEWDEAPAQPPSASDGSHGTASDEDEDPDDGEAGEDDASQTSAEEQEAKKPKHERNEHEGKEED